MLQLAVTLAIIASTFITINVVHGYWMRRATKANLRKGNPQKTRAPPNLVLVSMGLVEGQRGSINIAGVMMLGIGMVFLAIGFIFLPITTEACADLATYQYSVNTSWDYADFTGYSSVVGITPLLILIGFLTASVITGMMGIKIMKGADGGADPGSLMMIGLSVVFIGIGLIIEPVALDGVASVLNSGSLTAFTGYESVLKMSPMLIHIAFITASVLSGYFGIKRLSSNVSEDI